MRTFKPICITHHWYAPYAPAHLHTLPIINTHLTHLCTLTLINKRLKRFCHLLLKILLCLMGPVQQSFIWSKFSVLNRKHSFWANLAPKIKIVSLSWNLVPRPIRIYTIQWWYCLFLFSTKIILFGQIWSKKTKLKVKV